MPKALWENHMPEVGRTPCREQHRATTAGRDHKRPFHIDMSVIHLDFPTT